MQPIIHCDQSSKITMSFLNESNHAWLVPIQATVTIIKKKVVMVINLIIDHITH